MPRSPRNICNARALYHNDNQEIANMQDCLFPQFAIITIRNFSSLVLVRNAPVAQIRNRRLPTDRRRTYTIAVTTRTPVMPMTHACC